MNEEREGRKYLKDANGEKWRPCNLNNYNLQNLPLLDLVATPSQPGYYLCSIGYQSVDTSKSLKKYQGLTISVRPINQTIVYPHVTYSFPLDSGDYALAKYHYSPTRGKSQVPLGSQEYVRFLQIMLKEEVKENSLISLLSKLKNLFF